MLWSVTQGARMDKDRIGASPLQSYWGRVPKRKPDRENYSESFNKNGFIVILLSRLFSMRKQLDPRIPILINNNVEKNHRSFIVLVGDKSRDQVRCALDLCF
jgi:hypothetical protein